MIKRKCEQLTAFGIEDGTHHISIVHPSGNRFIFCSDGFESTETRMMSLIV